LGSGKKTTVFFTVSLKGEVSFFLPLLVINRKKTERTLFIIPVATFQLIL